MFVHLKIKRKNREKSSEQLNQHEHAIKLNQQKATEHEKNTHPNRFTRATIIDESVRSRIFW
jgi:hypothetical protein